MENAKLYEEYIENNYEELKKISKNEVGSTYLARNRHTGALVIKKQVSLEIGNIYKRLQKIDSPNLAPILEICFQEKYCIVVERYISGETIGQRLERKGKFMEDEAIYFCAQILRCLQKVHKSGIVHRDLTPANILVSVDGIVKIIDFGIARTPKENQTEDTVIMGTRGYASPEQFGFRQTDARTDIYAFGILLNKMLTGYMPNEQLPEKRKYRKIIKKCTMMEPKERYMSVGEILKEFGKEAGENIWETDRCIWPGFRKNVRWHKVVAVIGYIYIGMGFILMVIEYSTNFISFLLECIAMFLFWIVSTMLITNFGRLDSRNDLYAKIPKVIRVGIRIILSFVVMVLGMIVHMYVLDMGK